MCCAQFAGVVKPPAPTSPRTLRAGYKWREYDTYILSCGNLLYEEVIFTHAHIEVTEASYREVELSCEAEGTV